MTRRPPVLSVCMPVYNERETLPAVLDALLAVPFPAPFEVVAVDDGSSDGSTEVLRGFAEALPGRLSAHVHEANRGKAAALSTAFGAARGAILCVQDADLEYDPRELVRLVRPVLSGRAEAAFGSRYLPASRREGGTFLQWFANRFLTTVSNAFTGLRLTDMETCFKVFRRDRLGPLPLRATRFGVEPELAARLAASGCRVLELPIAYRGRTRSQGKKIGWRDGLEAVGWVVRMGARFPPAP